ncbi:hypothetical protein XENTR_v10002479 [Xenopus tropicalis]|nr:hypothetical protein XENTR_v10002479 [Xenopus tropicalis]
MLACCNVLSFPMCQLHRALHCSSCILTLITGNLRCLVALVSDVSINIHSDEVCDCPAATLSAPDILQIWF